MKKDLKQSLKTMYFVGGVLVTINTLALLVAGTISLSVFLAVGLIYFGLIPTTYKLINNYIKNTPGGRVSELAGKAVNLLKSVKTYELDTGLLLAKRQQLNSGMQKINNIAFKEKYLKTYVNYKESAVTLNKSLSNLIDNCSDDEIGMIKNLFRNDDVKYNFTYVPEVEFFSELILYKHEKEQMIEKDLINYEKKLTKLNNIHHKGLYESTLDQKGLTSISDKIAQVEAKANIVKQEPEKLNVKAKKDAEIILELLQQVSNTEKETSSIFLFEEDFKAWADDEFQKSDPIDITYDDEEMGM